MNPDTYAKLLENKLQIACGMAFDYGALVFLAARFMRAALPADCACAPCTNQRALKVLVACLV